MPVSYQLDANHIRHLSIILIHAIWQGVIIWLLLRSFLPKLQNRSASLRYNLLVTGMWLMLICPVMTWSASEAPHRSSLSPARQYPEAPTLSRDQQAAFYSSNGSLNLLPEFTLDKQNRPAHSELLNPLHFGKSTRQSNDLPAAASHHWRLQSVASVTQYWLIFLWVMGVSFFTLRLLFGYLWTFRIAHSRTPISMELMRSVTEKRCAQRWFIKPRVYIADYAREAILTGFIRPIVLIPTSWMTHLETETLEVIILHELTHFRRFDLWIILVQRIAESLLFFHPAIWWISNRISFERELCCDTETARVCGSSLRYVEALEQVATQLLHQSISKRISDRWFHRVVTLNFGEQKMELLARIQHVLKLDSSQASRKIHQSHHGLSMLLIPLLLIGLGASLLQLNADEPQRKQDFNPMENLEANTFQQQQSEQDPPTSGQLLFGIGVNSDAGVAGQILLEEKSTFNIPKETQAEQQDWNLRLEGALNRKVEIDTTGKSLKAIFAIISDKHFHNRLKIDEDELFKSGLSLEERAELKLSGISMRSTLEILLSPIGAAWYIDEGQIVITSNLKETYHRVTRKYDVAAILSFDDFFEKKHELVSQADRSASLIDFLKIDPENRTWGDRLQFKPIEFNSDSKSITVKVSQSDQNEIQTRIKLLQEIIAGERIQNSQILLSHVFPTLNNKRNSIQQFLENYKEQQRLKFAYELIAERLTCRSSIHLVNEKFSELAKFVADQAGINVVIDEAGLAEAGINSSEEITVRLNEISFSSMLEVVLNDLGLAMIIEDEVLKITSQERVRGELIVVVFQVADLIDQNGDIETELQRLSSKIESIIEPESWSSVGGPGEITTHPSTKSFIVRQHRSVHQEIQWVLEQLRAVRAGQEPERRALPNKSQSALLKNASRFPLEFKDVRLAPVLRYISRQTDSQFYIDQNGVLEAGSTDKNTISVWLNSTTLESALNSILSQLNLSYTVHENVFVITSKQRARGPLLVQVYSVQEKYLKRRGLRTFCKDIASTISPMTWDLNGGNGSITFDAKSKAIIVRQSVEVHKEIAAYLD